MKIAIVGPEESKWTEEQIPKVKCAIAQILDFAKNRRGLARHDGIMKWITNDFPPYFGFYSWNNCKFIGEVEVILVSGHCPKGGVDIWAEEVADELSIKKEIYPAEVNQWEDKIHDYDTLPIRQKGYHSRNIQIAKACDVLYCFVPNTHSNLSRTMYVEILSKNQYCIHCKIPDHPTNGGCWTMKYAKKLGKEVHLVVI